MEVKSVESYRLNLRAAARALWSSQIDYFDFYNEMLLDIERGFEQAWEEGMSSVGLSMQDATQEERDRLRSEILKERRFVDKLADFIEANSKIQGGKLSVVMQRVDLWLNAYGRIYQLARSYAAKDEKLEWVMHPAEHCQSCLKLSGKVKRASFWRQHNVTPKSWSMLDCKSGCKCTLEKTTKPTSSGPLPMLP